MTDISAALAGALAGRYRILREIGHGGMAIVFLAEDLRHPRSVAIKVMRPELSHSAGAERFQREVEIAAGLSHPRILPLIDSGVAGEVMWFAMPFVAGGSLRSRLDREGPLPVAEALAIAGAVASALSHAHRQGVVHRDVKPENILLMEGEPLLTDFGLARLASSPPGRGVTTTGMTLGTPGYMSPEQYAGGNIDARTDVYNLGCVLYEMLAGQPPFTGPSAEVVAFQHLNAAPPDVRQIRQAIPPALAQAIQRAMAKHSADRFASVEEFRKQLAEAAAETTAADRSAAIATTLDAIPASTGASARRSRAGRMRGAVALGALLIGVAVAALLLWRRGHERATGSAPGLPAGTGRTPLAVFPFDGHVPAGSQYVVEGVRTLLTSYVDGFGETRTVDARRVDEAVRRMPSALTDDGSARHVAAELGAGRSVQGGVWINGHTVRVEAKLLLKSGIRDTSVVASAEGDLDSLSRVVEAVARGIISPLVSGEDELGQWMSSVHTPPLEALRFYQAALLEPSIPGTVDLLTRATQADSTFALAWSQLSSAQSFAGQFEAAQRSSARALRLGDRLPLHARLLLQANTAAQLVDPDRAEHLYRQVISDYPDDASGWLGLGNTLFRFSALRGRRVMEARQPFLEAVRLDSTRSSEAVVGLLRIEMASKNVLGTDSLLRANRAQLERAGYGALVPAVSAWLAYERDDPAARRKALRDAQGGSADLGGAMALIEEAGDPEAALQLGRTAIGLAPEPTVRAALEIECALFALGGGRAREAREFLRAVDRTDSVYARCVGGLFLTSEFVPCAPAELDSMRVALEKLDDGESSVEQGATEDFRQWEGAPQPIRRYVLGRLCVRLGRLDEARALAQLLARTTGPAEVQVWAKNYSLGVLAAIDARERRWSEARDRLDRLSPGTKPGNRFIFHTLTQERFLHAQALQGIGDLHAALDWYGCMSELFYTDHVVMGPCTLAQAEICEHLGRTDEAIRHYRFFCKLWRGCDPELRPLVERARARLAILERRKG